MKQRLRHLLRRMRHKHARVVALLATYNEERFIRNCLEHLIGQGVKVYLIDNGSTDDTPRIAHEYLGRGLIGMGSFPREGGVYQWQEILERKEELSRSLDAEWFIHVDADEILLPPRPKQTLSEALAEAQEAGYNAVDFREFVFVPTRESPDHDHPNYQKTMRWYYSFQPVPRPRLMRAWRRQEGPIGLGSRGGHRLDFPGMKLYPEKFRMKHYLFLSVPHLLSKYGNRGFRKEELERGWHGWRARLDERKIILPSERELKTCGPDGALDFSNPRTQHITAEWAASE